jgi:hypothetical protein
MLDSAHLGTVIIARICTSCFTITALSIIPGLFIRLFHVLLTTDSGYARSCRDF